MKGNKEVTKAVKDIETKSREEKGAEERAENARRGGGLGNHHSPEPGRWAPAGADSPPAGL